jgi:predicted DNA-binding protein (UPF0251 family)
MKRRHVTIGPSSELMSQSLPLPAPKMDLTIGTRSVQDVVETPARRVTPICRPKTVCTRSSLNRPKKDNRMPSINSKCSPMPYYAMFYSNLETLRLGDHESAAQANNAAVVAIESTLFNQNSIQCIDFYDKRLGPLVGEALGQLLDFKREHNVQHNIKVMILDMNHKIGSKGAAPLLKSLGMDTVVTTLHLENILSVCVCSPADTHPWCVPHAHIRSSIFVLMKSGCVASLRERVCLACRIPMINPAS